MIRCLKAYWKTLICAGLILYLSLIKETLALEPLFSWQDKAFHAIAYCVLSVVFGVELWNENVREWRYWLFVLLLPIMYGGVMELLQEYCFPPRVGDWLDFIANAVGVILAGLICRIFVTK